MKSWDELKVNWMEKKVVWMIRYDTGIYLMHCFTARFNVLIFHCKCNACSGVLECQDEIVKEFLTVHALLYPDQDPEPEKRSVNWAQESKYFERYTELSLKTDIGRVTDKTKMLDLLVTAAHMARDQDLLKKAMAMWKEVIENTKLEELREPYEAAERKLSQWAKNLKTKKPPKRKEQVTFMDRMDRSYM